MQNTFQMYRFCFYFFNGHLNYLYLTIQGVAALKSRELLVFTNQYQYLY